MAVVLVVSEIWLKRLLEDYHSFLPISAGKRDFWRKLLLGEGALSNFSSVQGVIIRACGEFCLGCIIKKMFRFNLTLKCIFQLSKHWIKKFPQLLGYTVLTENPRKILERDEARPWQIMYMCICDIFRIMNFTNCWIIF